MWIKVLSFGVCFKSVASFCHPQYLLRTSARSIACTWNSRIWHFHVNNGKSAVKISPIIVATFTTMVPFLGYFAPLTKKVKKSKKRVKGFYAGRRTDFWDKKSSDFSGEIFWERNFGSSITALQICSHQLAVLIRLNRFLKIEKIEIDLIDLNRFKSI